LRRGADGRGYIPLDIGDTMTDRIAPSVRRDQAGFTLAELLLASVLGAMLLTALAVSTFGFTHTLDYMESKAGVTDDADPVLRRITKEIRESWWVEQPEEQKILVADANGDVTEYFIEDAKLWVKRPNGDTGYIYSDFADFTIESSTMPRKREGPLVDADGIFYQSGVSGTATTLVANGASGESISLAFTAPAVPSEVPGEAAADEEVKSVLASVVDVPLTYVHVTGSNNVAFQIYESWAPGKARPYGSQIASVSVSGSSLPAAVASGGGWAVPISNVAVALSAPLEPGTGYSLVITPQGNNIVVLRKVNVAPSIDHDDVAKLSGSSWVDQACVVPFDVKGPWSRTSTLNYDVISLVTLTAWPTNSPLQQRSAAVLSQAITEDPWLGVVPGEIAP
jgi:prepilin-type N-terminal cleavage/methylation domain-containing protein